MPIRFRCVYCGQLLSIATRKIGTSVDCPKCSHPNVVPEKDQLKEKEGPLSSGPSATTKAFESKRFDRWLGRSEVSDEGSKVDSGDVEAIAEPSDGGATGSESASAVEEPWKRPPEGLPSERVYETPAETVAISASAAIPLAILVVVLLLTSFGLGIVVGRYAWPLPAGSDGESPETAASASVTEAVVADTDSNGSSRPAIEGMKFAGRIEFRNANEDVRSADTGAVIMALPSKNQPSADRKIPVNGLRPGEKELGGSIERIRSYGGGFATAGADGSFEMTVSQPDSYWVLILSRQVERDPANKLFPSEVDTLAQYFDDVEALLADREFRLFNRVAKPGSPSSPINVEFRSQP